MIDMDAGFSGQLKIRERPGMSQSFRPDRKGHVGAVASQEMDRFFRDVTQIQTNIFIDACKRNDVKVLTPTMLYDFAPSDSRALTYPDVPRTSPSFGRSSGNPFWGGC